MHLTSSTPSLQSHTARPRLQAVCRCFCQSYSTPPSPASTSFAQTVKIPSSAALSPSEFSLATFLTQSAIQMCFVLLSYKFSSPAKTSASVHK